MASSEQKKLIALLRQRAYQQAVELDAARAKIKFLMNFRKYQAGNAHYGDF